MGMCGVRVGWHSIRMGAAFLFSVAIGQTAYATPPAHLLSCPAQTPATWGSLAGVLNGAEILSMPHGDKINEQAKPSMVPDSWDQRGARIRQIWHMNAEGPDWDYYVDCHYSGTSRILRLDAGKVKICERQFDAGQPDRGAQSLTCD